MKTLLKTTAAAGVLVSLAACASAPEPEPVEAPAPAPAPEPAPTPAPPPPPPPPPPPAPETFGPVDGSIDDFRVNVGERVYFDLDQSRLDSDDREILMRQAAWLQSYPETRILVAGNCDERGTREYNLALGERRASVVKDYLVSQGIDPARIDTISYGKERPIAAGSNEQAWAQNRNGFTQITSGAVG
ncbi:MAG: peptidoglycan-associated lipoprotein Pal [Pseudomonadota bacterium]